MVLLSVPSRQKMATRLRWHPKVPPDFPTVTTFLRSQSRESVIESETNDQQLPGISVTVNHVSRQTWARANENALVISVMHSR